MAKRELPAVQGEEKRTRRPALPLSDRAAEIIRDSAKHMDVSQDYLKEVITATRALPGGAKVANLDDFVSIICSGLCEEADLERAEKRRAIFTKPLDPAAVEKPIRERVEGA